MVTIKRQQNNVGGRPRQNHIVLDGCFYYQMTIQVLVDDLKKSDTTYRACPELDSGMQRYFNERRE